MYKRIGNKPRFLFFSCSFSLSAAAMDGRPSNAIISVCGPLARAMSVLYLYGAPPLRLPVLVHTYAVLSGNQAVAVNGTTSGLTWGWALEAPFSPPPNDSRSSIGDILDQPMLVLHWSGACDWPLLL